MFISYFELSIFMGQQEVYDFLRNHPQHWFTSRNISEGINQSIGSVTVCLKKLRIRGEILYKSAEKQKGKRVQYLYKFKNKIT